MTDLKFEVGIRRLKQVVVPIGLEPTTSTMSRWHSTNWVTGPKRNGSISKKSLNSKQILIFRKIPPKFYHLALTEILYKISPRRQIPVEILREISRFCQNPHAEILREISWSFQNPRKI